MNRVTLLLIFSLLLYASIFALVVELRTCEANLLEIISGSVTLYQCGLFTVALLSLLSILAILTTSKSINQKMEEEPFVI